MKKNLKKYTYGTLSVLLATSLITTTVAAEESIGNMPTQETPNEDGGYGYNGPTGVVEGPQEPEEDGSDVENSEPYEPVQTTDSHVEQNNRFTPEEDEYINNYLRELSKSLGGAPVGLTEGEASELIRKYRSGEIGQVKKQNSVVTTNQTTTKEKNDNLEHSVVEDKEIEKDIYSVKFVTLDKSTGNKKVHDFKNEEKDKEEDKVDYSKEPARVGTTPGAAYAIVELEDGIYGQLVADRKSGKKLITVKYNLLKETIEKGSWEYKDEEVVEVKKEETTSR